MGDTIYTNAGMQNITGPAPFVHDGSFEKLMGPTASEFDPTSERGIAAIDKLTSLALGDELFGPRHPDVLTISSAFVFDGLIALLRSTCSDAQLVRLVSTKNKNARVTNAALAALDQRSGLATAAESAPKFPTPAPERF